MNMKNRISMGIAVAAVLGAVALVPASADNRDEAAAYSPAAVTALASVETPQDQVWDMTYGAEQPVAVEAAVEAAEQATEDAPIVDYTFG